jgi:hypothetical protein
MNTAQDWPIVPSEPNCGGDYFDGRPATAEDLADVQWRLSQTANDPNLTLVTGLVVDFDFPYWMEIQGERKAEWE